MLHLINVGNKEHFPVKHVEDMCESEFCLAHVTGRHLRAGFVTALFPGTRGNASMNFLVVLMEDALHSLLPC